MEIITIGLDLAKSVFQVHGVDASGQVVIRKSLRRAQMVPFFARLPSCLVGMEACGTSHYWERELIKLGHQVRMMPPAYVKPYVKRCKTDAADTDAVGEAVARPTMRFVPVKSREQQAAPSMHRTRDLLVKQRTQLVNMIRGLLAEFGIDIPKGLERALLNGATDPRWRSTGRADGSCQDRRVRCRSRRSTSTSGFLRSIAICLSGSVAMMPQ
jgi:transposase